MGIYNLYRKLTVVIAIALLGYANILFGFYARRNDVMPNYNEVDRSEYSTLADLARLPNVLSPQKPTPRLNQSAQTPKPASNTRTHPDPVEFTSDRTARPNILVWAKQKHRIGWTFPILENGDGGCNLTFDRNAIATADAVVFHMKTCNSEDLPDPNIRRKDQTFVWWAQESPWSVLHYSHQDLKEYNDYFNWTMTFRMDSDVLAPMWPVPSMDYLLMKLGRTGEMVDKNLAEKPTLTEEYFQREVKHLMSRKSRLVSWVASDCDLTWGANHRREVVFSLQRKGKIRVDKFGKCADRPIPRNNTVLFEKLSPYKFYLAFENSFHCRDYITEKTIYNSLVGGNVPVIYGASRQNVEKILPRNSFIHVEDFKNMKEVGDYLRYLDKNDTAYMEYFQWWKEPGAQTFPRFGFNYGPKYLAEKSDYRHFEKDEIQDDSLELERFGFYHLCRKLKNGDHKKTFKTIPNLAKWWFGAETSQCLGFQGNWQMLR